MKKTILWLLLLGAAISGYAQEWTRLDLPKGEDTYELFVYNNLMYAGGAFGYRTRSSGLNQPWEQINEFKRDMPTPSATQGLRACSTRLEVLSLEPFVINETILLRASLDGVNWQTFDSVTVDDLPVYLSTLDLLTAILRDDILLLHVGEFAGLQRVTLMSYDDGATWLNADSIWNQSLEAFQVSIQTKAIVATEASTDEYLISYDDAQTWQPFHSIDTTTSANGNLRSFLLNGFSGQGSEQFVGTSGQGVLFRPDSLSPWQPLNDGLPIVNTSNQIHPSVYDLYRYQGQVLAATLRGVYAFSQATSTWEPYGTGLTGVLCRDLIADDLGNLWVATALGTYRLPPGSTAWESQNAGFPEIDVRLSAADGASVLLGGQGSLYYADNYGEAFTRLDAALGPVYNEALADTLLFAVREDDQHVYRSADRGTTWQVVEALGGAGLSFQLSRRADGTLLALDGQARPFLSQDGGLTWTQNNEGLPIGGLQLSLAASTSRWWYGRSTGLYSQAAGGGAWQQAQGPTGPVLTLVARGDTVAMTNFAQELWVSTDEGASWQQRTPAGAVGAQPGENLLVHLLDDKLYLRVVYASTPTAFFGSANLGVSWSEATDLPDNAARLLVTQTHAYVQERDYTLWRRPLDGVTSLPEAMPTPAGLAVYPNPLRSGAALRVDTEATALHLYDVRGRRVAEGARRGGRWEVPTAGLSAGVYVLRAVTDGGPQTARVLVY